MGQRRRPMYYTAHLLHDGTVLWAYPIRKPSKQELKLNRIRIDTDGLARVWADAGRDIRDVTNETRTRFQDIIATNLNTRRSLRQLVLPLLAEALGEVLTKEKITLTAVLNYELPLDKVVARLGGRHMCPGCKAVFHISARPPRVQGVCDHCGGSLYQRDDDRPEAVRTRMEVYEKSTRPLIDYYEQRGTLITIEAEGSPEEIYQTTVDFLGGVLA